MFDFIPLPALAFGIFISSLILVQQTLIWPATAVPGNTRHRYLALYLLVIAVLLVELAFVTAPGTSDRLILLDPK